MYLLKVNILNPSTDDLLFYFDLSAIFFYFFVCLFFFSKESKSVMGL